MYDLYDLHLCGIHCTDTKTQNLRAWVTFYWLSEVKVILLKKQVEYEQSSLGSVVIRNLYKGYEHIICSEVEDSVSYLESIREVMKLSD